MKLLLPGATLPHPFSLIYGGQHIPALPCSAGFQMFNVNIFFAWMHGNLILS